MINIQKVHVYSAAGWPNNILLRMSEFLEEVAALDITRQINPPCFGTRRRNEACGQPVVVME